MFICSSIHLIDLEPELLGDDVPLDLHRRSHLPAGNAEVTGQDRPLLQPLSLGYCFVVGSPDSSLDGVGYLVCLCS